MEDIVSVLDGQTDFNDLLGCPASVNQYLKQRFGKFLKDSRFLESLSGHLEPGPTNTQHVKKLIAFLEHWSRG
jgi:hypothetical protein